MKHITSKNHAEAGIPILASKFTFHVFQMNGKEHVTLTLGNLREHEVVPVRLHSECLTSEVFGSLKCDCKEQLHAALSYIEKQGVGALVYLRQEGRGIGLFNKIRAYALQEKGLDTVEANAALGFDDDLREYNSAMDILRYLGITTVDLLTNNPNKLNAFDNSEIKVHSRIPLIITPNPHNENYLRTKELRSGHMLSNYLENRRAA